MCKGTNSILYSTYFHIQILIWVYRQHTTIYDCYRRLGHRFLCYFLCPPSCSLKESRRLLPPTHSKTGVKSRYHREHFFQHITIYPLVRFDVFRLALECLFAECPAVEAHIVEVCPCIIDDVKAVGTRLVPRKAHA